MKRPFLGNTLFPEASISKYPSRVRIRTRRIIVPHDGTLDILLEGLEVPGQLTIHLGAKRGELLLEIGVIVDTSHEHVGHDIDGRLEIGVMLKHHTDNQVLQIAIGLLLLQKGWEVSEQSDLPRPICTYIERAQILNKL